MLKLTGAALVAAALSTAGFVWAGMESRRLRATEQAVNAVELLRGQVVLLLRPLDAAISILSTQNALLARLADAGCIIQGEALRAELARAGLGKAQIAVMESLFEAIPSLPAGQGAPFDAAREQLNLQLAAQRKAVGQGAALYPRLGILAGLAAFVLLV